MNLKSKIKALQFLNKFNNDMKNYKSSIIQKYTKNKFQNQEILSILEGLTLYENEIYKKFNRYQSLEEEIDLKILEDTFGHIQGQCKKLLDHYKIF
jgi:hypothetical protein